MPAILTPEQPVRVPERPAAPKPEARPKEPLGPIEQQVAERIKQDGDPDRVLQDIAGETTEKTIRAPGIEPTPSENRPATKETIPTAQADNSERVSPRSEKLDKVVEEAQKFEQSVLDPWIDEAKSLAEGIKSLQEKPEPDQELVLPEDLKAEVSKAEEIKKEVELMEQQLRQGQIPELAEPEKPGLMERVRLRIDGGYRRGVQRQRVEMVKEDVNQKRSELGSIRQTQTERYEKQKKLAIDSVTTQEKNASQIAEILEKKAIIAPSGVKKAVEYADALKRNLNQLQQYSAILPGSHYQELTDLNNRTSRVIFGVEKLFQNQLALIIERGNSYLKLIDSISGNQQMFEGFPQFGGFAELALIPNPEQATAVIQFELQLRQLQQAQSQILGRPSPEAEKNQSRFEQEFSKRRESLKRKNEQIASSYVSHMTPVDSAQRILREGSLINSAGQRVTRGEFQINSTGGKTRGELQSLAFAINGAELQYSKGEDITGQEHRGELGVGFVFPYSSVVEGNQFREQSSSQGQGVEHYDELHVLGANFDARNPKDEDLVVKTDIDKGFFIAPASQREHWTAFSMTPIEQGGAGKDQAWVDQHLVFYPDGTRPDQFVASARQTGVFNGIRSTEGSLVPTGKIDTLASGGKTPLFSWVKS